MDPTFVIAAAFFVVAILYASVGHAGASGYLATMALLGVVPETLRPTALALNVLSAAIVTARFAHAGLVPWRALLPFAAGSIPLAYIGGGIELPGAVYRPLLGVVLVVAAWRLATTARSALDDTAPVRAPVVASVVIGGAIGLLSGLVGTGGGIFLSPIVLFLGWASTRRTSGLAAGFILATSAAGLAGNVAAVQSIPDAIPLWAAAVAIGALLGTEIGTARAGAPTLRRLLAVILVVAALKFILIG